MGVPTESLPGLLSTALARDGARPFVTFYDDATGERVELSVTTFDNWVAKTANLLVDDLAVEPGARIVVDLPLHWQTAVWLCAAWAAGAVPVVGTAPGAAARDDVDVVVCGPELPEPLPRRADVVALSLRPLGGRFAAPLPSGVLDYAAEVAGHGDRFAPRQAPAGGAEVVLIVGDDEITVDTLLAESRRLAEAWAMSAGGRLLTDLEPGTTAGVAALVTTALVTDGSTVLVRNADADAARTEARVDAEHVTARVSR
jgi:uncharacterized protein (TIGR03089 family)